MALTLARGGAELEEAGICTCFTDLFEGWAQLEEGAMRCAGLEDAARREYAYLYADAGRVLGV